MARIYEQVQNLMSLSLVYLVRILIILLFLSSFSLFRLLIKIQQNFEGVLIFDSRIGQCCVQIEI